MWSRRQWSLTAVPAVMLRGRAQAQGPGRGNQQPAAQGRLDLELEPPATGLNEVAWLEVTLTLPGRPDEVGTPQIRVDPSVQVRAAGQSSTQTTQIINGRYSVTARFIFRFQLIASQVGRFPVSGKILVDGRWIRANNRPRLNVGKGSAVAPSASQRGDDVMLVPHLTPKGALYVGQLGFYQLELWSRGGVAPSSLNRPKFRDFITEDFDPPGRKIVSYRGSNYDVRSVFYRAVFPQKAGTLEIDSVELLMQPAGLGSLFGRRRSARPYTLRSEPLSVEVLELPARGKPAGFPESHVGTFALHANVDRTDLTVGDAVTLTLEVTGTGNLRLLDPGPLPKIAGVRSYEPKRDEPTYTVQGQQVRGVVRWSYLLITDRAGTLQVPEMTLPYFDPDKARYEVAKSPAITLDVKDKSGAVPQVAPEAPERPGSPEDPEAPSTDTAQDMEFAALVADDALEDRQGRPSNWLSDRLYVGAVALAPTVVAAVAGQRSFATRFGHAQRQLQRARQAELQTLLETASDGQESQGWAALGQLLQRLALLRAGPEAHGLPRPELMQRMVRAGLPEQEAKDWERWLDLCDSARFGAGAADPEKRTEACDFARRELERSKEREG